MKKKPTIRLSQHITHEADAKLLNLMKVVIDTPLHLQDLIDSEEDLFCFESPMLGENKASKSILTGT